MKSIILEICRSYKNANILLKMLSVLHTLYRYTVLLSLVAHAGMVVTCIALPKKTQKKQKKPKNQKTTKKHQKKTPPQRTVGNVIFACNDRSLHRRYERTKTSLSL